MMYVTFLHLNIDVWVPTTISNQIHVWSNYRLVTFMQLSIYVWVPTIIGNQCDT